MAKTVYPQSYPFKTLTVGELIERLSSLDPAAPAIFRLPQFGAFGSGQEYSIERVEAVRLERKELHIPATMALDDETGEEYMTEAETQVWKEWKGVVIE